MIFSVSKHIKESVLSQPLQRQYSFRINAQILQYSHDILARSATTLCDILARSANIFRSMCFMDDSFATHAVSQRRFKPEEDLYLIIIICVYF